jgi:hypothetical protein
LIVKRPLPKKETDCLKTKMKVDSKKAIGQKKMDYKEGCDPENKNEEILARPM